MWEKVIDIEDNLKCYRSLSKDLTRTPIYCALGPLEIRLNPAVWPEYEVSDCNFFCFYLDRNV